MRVLKVAILALALSASAQAGPRDDHWSGFDFGVGGTPFPSFFGATLGFNTGDEARISVGYGVFGGYSVYPVDFKFFLSPTPWSVYFGAGLDLMTGSRQSIYIWDFDFDTGLLPYIQMGIDFQSDVGVHVSFNLGGAATSGELVVLPGLAVGWYF